VSSRRVLISTGELSGDQHAADVARALRALSPDLDIEAVGGAALAASGAHLVGSIDDLAAVGLAEAVRQLPEHVRRLRALETAFRSGRYDLVIVVDYPGLHLRVAAAARRHGVPVVYYIAPQLWAWGAWRARRLRRCVTRLAVILPFEEAFFRARGIPAEFVGHPLVGRPCGPARADACARLGLDASHPVLGLFPGSRPAEIERHWRLFRDAAALAARTVPGLQTLVSGVSGASYPDPTAIVHVGDPSLVFGAADAAICKSGTTTLEAALSDTPHVLAYRVHPATFAVARRLVQVRHIGLVNLIAQRDVTPERLQRAATPERLAQDLIPLLDADSRLARAQRAGFAEVRERLRNVDGEGAADRVAAIALGLAA